MGTGSLSVVGWRWSPLLVDFCLPPSRELCSGLSGAATAEARPFLSKQDTTPLFIIKCVTSVFFHFFLCPPQQKLHLLKCYCHAHKLQGMQHSADLTLCTEHIYYFPYQKLGLYIFIFHKYAKYHKGYMLSFD